MEKIINDKQYKEYVSLIETLLTKVDNETEKNNPDFIELDKISN